MNSSYSINKFKVFLYVIKLSQLNFCLNINTSFLDMMYSSYGNNIVAENFEF